MQKEKKQGNINKAFMALCITAAVLFLLYSFSRQSTGGRPSADKIQLVSTSVGVTYKYDAFAGFYSNQGGNFFFYTKDGIKYMTAQGEVKWDFPYTMSMPAASGKGSVIAVAESNGTTLFVFDAKGPLYSKQFDYPIINFFVNASGYTTVLLQEKNTYRTQILDAYGNESGAMAHQDKNIFPVASDISNDSKIKAVGLLNIDGTNIATRFIFQDVAKQDIFSSLTLDKQMLVSMSFLENNRLVAVTDTGLHSISFPRLSDSKLDNTFQLSNRIDQLRYMGDKGFVAVLGDGLADKLAEPPGTVCFFNSECALTGKHSLGGKVTYISAASDRVILGINHTYYAMNGKGQLLWQYEAVQDIKDFLLLDNNTVLLATGTEANVLKIKKTGDGL